MKLKNEFIEIEVCEHGAEMTMLKRLSDGTMMLWDADPEYWKRHSPVLFPIVGSLWGGECRINGAVYRMGQHGFARDMDFALVSSTENEVWYRLASGPETLAKYPYDFVLEIGYRLEGAAVRVLWKVSNPSLGNVLDFQIGAHPAFNLLGATSLDGGSFRLTKAAVPVDSVECGLISNGGLSEKSRHIECPGGLIRILPDSFAGDALIIEHNQADCVELLTPAGVPYIKVGFEAPLFGLWGPRKDSIAPFVCIEPWEGRCDREGYDGEFRDKDWTRHLAPGATWRSSYLIEVLG